MTTWSRRRMARVELILRKEVAGGGEGSSPTWLVKIKSSVMIVNVKALTRW